MKNLTKEQYIDSIINTHDYQTSIHTLTDSELSHLASLFWDEECRDPYPLSENFKVSDLIMNLLQVGDTDSKLDLTDIIRESIVDTYYSRMDQLISERVIYLKQDEMRENGFYPKTDTENGEIYWSHGA